MSGRLSAPMVDPMFETCDVAPDLTVEDHGWLDILPDRPQAEIDDYGYSATPWAGGLVITPMIELEMPVADKTQAELAVPSMLGGAMQFARTMQEAALSVVVPDMPPPTETRRFPISLN